MPAPADVLIRAPLRPEDDDALWSILEPVIREGATYPVACDATREEAFAYWFAPDKTVYLAEHDGQVLGTYYIKRNSTGPAAHVANAGFMTHPEKRGRGVARAMALDCFACAKAAGYLAMQFNLVIATNAAAIHLWHSVGMETVGLLPGAFRHRELGYVDALVMYRQL